MENASLEEWRVTVHPDYEVSNLGRVRSYAHRGGRGRAVSPHLLALHPDTRGYLSVHITARYNYRVHTLVALAFIGPCPPGHEVLHADDNRINAAFENLSYGTRSQNLKDCYARGRR